MPGALVSTVSDVLKYRYLGPVQSSLNNEVLVTQILDLSTDVDLDGLKAVVPLHHGRTGGIGARLEDEDLPAAGNQKYKKAEFDLSYQYGRARFTGQAIQKTKTDAGAFIRVVTEELDRLRDDLALDMARQFYGNGDAIVANTGVTSASTTVVLADDEAIQRGFLYVGMVIDIGTAANPVSVASAREITDVNPSGPNIVISGAAVTTAGTDRIFRSGNAAASSVVKEIDLGLQKLISTSANTVGGINAGAAGTRFWDNLRDTAGGAISLSSLMVNWNKAHAAGARSGDVVAITTPGLARRLFETSDFKSQIQFVNTQSLKGGFEEISFGTSQGRVRMTPDRLAPRGKVFFVPKKHIKVYSNGDWDFLQRDGLTIRWVDNRDAFQAVLHRYINLGTNRRNTSMVLSGLTDTDF